MPDDPEGPQDRTNGITRGVFRDLGEFAAVGLLAGAVPFAIFVAVVTQKTGHVPPRFEVLGHGEGFPAILVLSAQATYCSTRLKGSGWTSAARVVLFVASLVELVLVAVLFAGVSADSTGGANLSRIEMHRVFTETWQAGMIAVFLDVAAVASRRALRSEGT